MGYVFTVIKMKLALQGVCELEVKSQWKKWKNFGEFDFK